jgi:hypothetical protein
VFNHHVVGDIPMILHFLVICPKMNWSPRKNIIIKGVKMGEKNEKTGQFVILKMMTTRCNM